MNYYVTLFGNQTNLYHTAARGVLKMQIYNAAQLFSDHHFLKEQILGVRAQEKSHWF
ncbi:hypothetical protein D3C87_1430620 [compost metagenome]